MPRILSVNNGPFSFSSSILSLEKENLEEFYGVSANTAVIDEGQSVVFSLQYRNVVTEKTIYWEILPSTNVTYEDFFTLMNGTFQIVNSGVEKVTITANKDFTNINEEITENFTIRFRENNSSGNILTTSTEVDILDTSYLAVGQQQYTTPGTYTFTVPENVNKISFVLIGGGGGHNWQIVDPKSGAGGGGLIYCNNLHVQEGQQIEIVVGNAGFSANTPTNGGTSSLTIDANTSPKTISAFGGGASVDYFTAGSGGTTSANTYFSSNGASFVGRTGGSGGLAKVGPSRNGGSGSAAGYSTNGVNGGAGGVSGSTGQGGSGGGGAGFYDGTGGGTGIWGQGNNGAGGIFQAGYNYPVSAGKAGSKLGSTEVYVQFGGGGASRLNFSDSLVGAFNAGTGAVRIIWPGQLRQYPTTRTSDETPTP
jgi:hypothetical protein